MTQSLALPRRGVAVAFASLLLVIAIPVARASDEIDAPPDVTITIGSGLSDREVTVDAGAVIEFVNRDDDRHRMRSRSGDKGFDTGNLEPGESYRFILAAAGRYDYIDERNDDRTAYHGRIVVRAPSAGGPDVDAVTVRIGDEVFAPASVTVAVGGEVTFENLDGDDHTATSTDGGPLASPVLTTGESYTATLPQPGTFAYLCAIHPEMTGTIEVVGEAPVAPPEPATPVDPTEPPAPAPTPATGGNGDGDGAPPAPVEIEMQDFAFDAPDVEVPIGTTVTWTNVGAAPHTATADDSSFDTTLVAPGGEASQTFATAGVYGYLCIFHPGMTGTIRVEGAASVPSATAEAAVQGPDQASGQGVGLEPSGAPDDSGESVSLDAAPSSSAIDGLARLVLVVTIVTIAGALFARAIQGTVRRAD